MGHVRKDHTISSKQSLASLNPYILVMTYWAMRFYMNIIPKLLPLKEESNTSFDGLVKEFGGISTSSRTQQLKPMKA